MNQSFGADDVKQGKFFIVQFWQICAYFRQGDQ